MPPYPQAFFNISNTLKSQSPVKFSSFFQSSKSTLVSTSSITLSTQMCIGDPGFVIYTRNTWDQTKVISCLFWSLFVSPLYLLSLANIIKLGWLLGMLTYGNLAKMYFSTPTPPYSICFGSYSLLSLSYARHIEFRFGECISVGEPSYLNLILF